MVPLMTLPAVLLALFIAVGATASTAKVVELTDLNFDERVLNQGVWFIDVYAPW